MGLECKNRKSRDSSSNRQVWPWSTKISMAKANRVLPREHTDHSNQVCYLYLYVIFWQHKRWLYTWTPPGGQYQSQTDYILCSQRWRSAIQSAKTRLGGNCGSDHELLVAKFRLKLKKVGKASKPCRYDLNQMLYDYTVEATNRFKRLDLVDRVPEALWMEFCNIVEEAMTKIISKKKKWKKCKMVV